MPCHSTDGGLPERPTSRSCLIAPALQIVIHITGGREPTSEIGGPVAATASATMMPVRGAQLGVPQAGALDKVPHFIGSLAPAYDTVRRSQTVARRCAPCVAPCV